MAGEQYLCKTCKRTLNRKLFYKSYRVDEYPPDGIIDECKECVTRDVNNFDESTFLPILKKIDMPYVQHIWVGLINKYGGKTPERLSGIAVLGRYMTVMHLAQWKDYRWEDTQRIKEKEDEDTRRAMLQKGYTDREIEEALAVKSIRESIAVPSSAAIAQATGPDPFAKKAKKAPAVEQPAVPTPEDFSSTQDIGTPSIDVLANDYFKDDLTEEDRKMLSIKWGPAYKAQEWVQLEQLYQDMMNNFDIQTAAHIDYLKLICKASLKAHQCIDMNDIDGFSRMSKIYDTLMHSAKFTAVQNNSENGEFVNAVCELVTLCERDGFIPKYYVDKPQDRVDEVLQDNRRYVDTLVREELNLGDLIEQSLRAIKYEENKEEYEDIDDDNELTVDQVEQLKDEDLKDFKDFLEAEAEEDVDGAPGSA